MEVKTLKARINDKCVELNIQNTKIDTDEFLDKFFYGMDEKLTPTGTKYTLEHCSIEWLVERHMTHIYVCITDEKPEQYFTNKQTKTFEKVYSFCDYSADAIINDIKSASNDMLKTITFLG